MMKYLKSIRSLIIPKRPFRGGFGYEVQILMFVLLWWYTYNTRTVKKYRVVPQSRMIAFNKLYIWWDSTWWPSVCFVYYIIKADVKSSRFCKTLYIYLNDLNLQKEDKETLWLAALALVIAVASFYSAH